MTKIIIKSLDKTTEQECPVCGGKIIAAARCQSHNSICENKHEWHTIYIDKERYIIIDKGDQSD